MSPAEASSQALPELSVLEAVLDYRFRDPALLETALCHSSFAHERTGVASNERLEFLGDSVLGIVVAHALFEVHPDWSEGDLTVALQNLVDARSLAKLGRAWGIGAHLRLGRTELQSGGERKPGILADAVEAILGAIYLDGGLGAVERLLRREFDDVLREGAPPVVRDPKTRFQEWVMARTGAFPVYECIGDSGIDGDENRFTVQVLVEDARWGEGVGRSKRVAERRAAVQALERVEREAGA